MSAPERMSASEQETSLDPEPEEPNSGSPSEWENTTTLAQAVVFLGLAFSGVGLLAVITFGTIDWVLPTVVYGFVAFLTWQHFF